MGATASPPGCLGKPSGHQPLGAWEAAVMRLHGLPLSRLVQPITEGLMGLECGLGLEQGIPTSPDSWVSALSVRPARHTGVRAQPRGWATGQSGGVG